jgi:hypothetical protein
MRVHIYPPDDGSGRRRIERGFLSTIISIPMDSESTAKVIDRVDLSQFHPHKIYTPNNAATMAALATMAYSTPKDQKAHLDRQAAVEDFHFLDSKNNEQLGIDFPDTGTQVSVVETSQAVLIAARGTSPPWLSNMGSENDVQWQDYLADLNAVPTPNYDGSAPVHAGFKEAADGIWTQLKPYLEMARAAHKPVHFAGHSLGAAVALQLADRMHNELGILPLSVTRTGGPDIGWDDEKKHLEEIGLAARTVNFVNNSDPIPMVLPLGETAGARVYFDRHGQARLEPGSHCLDRIVGTVAGLARCHPSPLYEHVPVFYNDRILDPKNSAVLQELQQQMES